jgi:hypothetical protein
MAAAGILERSYALTQWLEPGVLVLDLPDERLGRRQLPPQRGDLG